MKKDSALLPEEVKASIPPLHTQDRLSDGEIHAYARLTCEELGMTWFVLELDRDGDLFSAYGVDKEQENFGYFSLSHLHSLVNRVIEHDVSFSKQLLLGAVKEERRRRALGRGAEPGLLKEVDCLSETRGYYYAAKYATEPKHEFRTIRHMMHYPQVSLSAYSLLMGEESLSWHLVVIGDRPPEHVHSRIMKALSKGTLTSIPYDLLLQLYDRHLQTGEDEE
jgi:hypothetical protein